MSNFKVKGNKKLSGRIKTNSAKNSAVAILCATTMIKGKTTLNQVPRIEEVNRIIEILSSLGMTISWKGEHELKIDNSEKIELKKLNKNSFIKTRSALLLMGSLSSILKNYSLPKPGGCKLGKRTVNPFTIALEKLNIKITETVHEFKINSAALKGTEITMYESSDTATENTIMAAVLAKGETRIHLASSNYMVQDLCCFLKKAGAKIDGIGTKELVITGVKSLEPIKNYSIMPDPIESMTFISAGVTTNSNLTITNCPIAFLRLELEKLRVMGQKFTITKSYKSKNNYFDLVDIEIFPSTLVALPDKIHPLPYPGLNMDNLPLFLPILTQVKGQTLVHDWPYEIRAIYYTEFNRFGANIMLHDAHRVTVTGKTKLQATEIVSPPALRPSICLLICMLAAKGTSILRNSYAIDRGYEDIVGRLNSIGADIKQIND